MLLRDSTLSTQPRHEFFSLTGTAVMLSGRYPLAESLYWSDTRLGDFAPELRDKAG
jgi:hypothetical protein